MAVFPKEVSVSHLENLLLQSGSHFFLKIYDKWKVTVKKAEW